MDVSEFVKLTPEAIADLIKGKTSSSEDPKCENNRRELRWPFRGTVELWVPDQNGDEIHTLATALNISANGLAILSDIELEIGQSMAIAVHLPEATYYGHASAKHATESPVGYIIGMQFNYKD